MDLQHKVSIGLAAFIGLFVVIFVIGAIAGSPKPRAARPIPTSSFNPFGAVTQQRYSRYTDPVYGFSFQYPDGWVAPSRGSNGTADGVSSYILNLRANPAAFRVVVNAVRPNFSGVADGTVVAHKSGCPQVCYYYRITIGGWPALLVATKQKGIGVTREYAYVNNQPYGFDIDISDSHGLSKYQEQEFRRILTTFSIGGHPTSTPTTAPTAPAAPTAPPSPTAPPTATSGPQVTPTAAPTATSSLSLSGDTYRQVNDHPDLYQGDTVQWTCNIAGFLGVDPNNSADTDIGCWEYTGKYQGDTGDGEVILIVPPQINTDAMDSGDDLQVLGKVDQPMQGKNAYGSAITTPALDVISLKDLGRDPNASGG